MELLISRKKTKILSKFVIELKKSYQNLKLYTQTLMINKHRRRCLSIKNANYDNKIYQKALKEY